MKKRLLAAIMSLCMIVSLLPVSTLAYEGEEGPAVQSRDGGYPAYFYVRFPSDGTEGDTHAQNLFTFAGTGSVSGVEAPNYHTGENKVVRVTDGITLNPPDGGETETHKAITVSTFPDITSGTKTYVYEGKATEADPYTYTVKWYRLVSEQGYNIIQDGTSYSFSVSGNNGYCWHVDGFIQFQDRHSVTYKVQFPGETGFSDVTESGEKETENIPYVDYLDGDETFGDATAPSMDKNKEYQGETYTFEGWYKYEDCTQEIGADDVITENITVYGKYVKKGPDITVTKELATVNGAAVVGDPEDTVLRVGDSVTWTVKVKNNTDDYISNVSLTDSLRTLYPDKVTIEPFGQETSFGLHTAGIEGDTKTFTVTYLEIADSYANKTLVNTATVTYSGKEYKATATNTVLPVEPTVDPDTDIFFFIAQPTSQILSDNENDYRYLTHGGVIDTEKAVEAGIDANGITDTNNETTITQYVQTWPESGALGDTTDVGFNVASEPVGTGSTWEIDEAGNVTSFSLVIDGKPYTSDQYEIRWVKISHATTANRDNPGITDINDSIRYHVDGMLYEKTTVEDILSKINITKTVEDNLWPYNDNGDQMTGAEFDIYLDRANDTGNQFIDIKIGKVTPNNGQYDFIVEAGLASKYLTPGEYVIKEVLTETQKVMWKAPETEYRFTLNSDGSVAVNGSVVANGQKEAFAFTNTAKTFSLIYDKGTAPEGTGVPTDTKEYTYNQEATVSSERPTWPGHTFKGWFYGTTTYQPDDPIRITTDTTLTAVWDTLPRYTLTYNPSGGTGAPGPDTNLLAGPHTLNSTTKPTYGSNIFLGWTADGSASGKIYEAGQQLPTIGPQVTIPNTTTVYAVWGADSNGDGTADAQQVLIVPADITVYQGGDGYDSVLDGTTEGSNVQSTGLPEPGYYITLPWQVNEDLKDTGAVADDEGIVNLSNYLSFTYNDGAGVERLWRIATYDADGNSRLSDGRYIYRILPDELTKTPIRLLFTNGAGDEFTSDDFFGIEDQLYDTLQMTIYRGGLEANYVQAQVVGTTALQDVGVGTGELVIRGTTNENPVSQIVTNAPSNVNQITAQAENVAYYINESPIQVQDPGTVRLLADELALTADTEPVMQEAAANAIQDTTLNNPQYDFMYLDLVDTSNGNAYVTLNQNNEDHAITIHWPMPANADPDSIHVVHFDGMDREFDVGDLSSYLGNVYEIENVDINGNVISFSTATFSPFVLVYEEDTSRPVNPNPGGGSGGDSDSDPTGNLSIELDVNGGDDEFTFTVILTDKDGDDLENNFYYNGDYTGTIGSGDEITLTGGDKIVIRNLPEGTRYEVIIETADGYTYVIDGEEGVIHTGMNEAEFTATRTVPVADPSVTGVSRWLNTTDHIAYLTGYPGGAFGPDNNMTRAEVAQMFYALLNNKNVTITKTFPDVPADAWYATAVNTLASLGMVSGDENGNYRPNDPITRAEFCVIALAFAYEPENAVCYFGDVSRSDWFYTYVAQAASYGWIGGYTNGNFGPNDRITRAQVTTIVNNMLGRAADRDYVIDHQADLVQFTDLTRAHWGYFQIMEATNAHDYTKSNGTENWR